MLDVLMVAHKPNFGRLAHRSLEVDGDDTRAVIRGSLPSAVDLVGTPGKVVMSLEGGQRQDFEPVEAYLHSQNLDWQIVHHEEVSTYREAVVRGLEECKSPYVAVIPAWIEVVDPMWVHRMMYPLGQDPLAILCTTHPEQGPAKDLAPGHVLPRKWPGGKFFVGRRDKIYENLRLCREDQFEEEFAKASSANGWRIWAHPGVRFKTHPHEEHARKKARQPAGAKTSNSDR